MSSLTKNFNSTHNLDLALLIARVGISLLMLTHGLPKMLMFFSDDSIQFPAVLGMSSEISLGLAVLAEVFCSILLLVGFGTRYAVIPLIITMAVAVFLIHGADPLVKKEMGLLYLLVYTIIFFAGSGKYSFDQATKKKFIEDPTLSIYS